MSHVTTYQWDEENHLVGVNKSDGTSEQYMYSGDGKRRRKAVAAHALEVTQYVWDEQNVLQETDAMGSLKAHYTDNPGYWGGLTSMYLGGVSPKPAPKSTFNQASFAEATFNQGDALSSSSSFFFHFDQQASVRQLTNAEGNVSDNYIYRAFGEEELSAGATRNPYRYQGQVGPYTDTENRTWIRSRIYNNEAGRWMSQDPIGFDSGDWNLYRFVGNNPVSYIDPDGEAIPLQLLACIPALACATALVAACSDCGTDLNCWGSCIPGTINHLPPSVKVLCGGSVGVCVARAAARAARPALRPETIRFPIGPGSRPVDLVTRNPLQPRLQPRIPPYILPVDPTDYRLIKWGCDFYRVIRDDPYARRQFFYCLGECVFEHFKPSSPTANIDPDDIGNLIDKINSYMVDRTCVLQCLMDRGVKLPSDIIVR